MALKSDYLLLAKTTFLSIVVSTNILQHMSANIEMALLSHKSWSKSLASIVVSFFVGFDLDILLLLDRPINNGLQEEPIVLYQKIQFFCFTDTFHG